MFTVEVEHFFRLMFFLFPHFYLFVSTDVFFSRYYYFSVSLFFLPGSRRKAHRVEVLLTRTPHTDTHLAAVEEEHGGEQRKGMG